MAVFFALIVFAGAFLMIYHSFDEWRRDLTPVPRVRVVSSAAASVAEVSDISAPTPPPEALPEPPPPAATPEPTAYVVANTGGDGVYLRRTPRMADRLKAWPDRTQMVIVGDDVQAEGRTWKHVRDPSGNVGWVPSQWLVPSR